MSTSKTYMRTSIHIIRYFSFMFNVDGRTRWINAAFQMPKLVYLTKVYFTSSQQKKKKKKKTWSNVKLMRYNITDEKVESFWSVCMFMFTCVDTLSLFKRNYMRNFILCICYVLMPCIDFILFQKRMTTS